MRFESDPSPSPEGVSERLASATDRSAGIDPRLSDFEDLAQEAWILRHRWEREGRVIPDSPRFHRGVLRNLARRRTRGESRRVQRERSVAESRPLDSPSAASLVERRDLLEALGRAMDSLEEPFRSTLRAHHAEGLSVAEIAEREGIAADTARWRLRRGHELTREVLLRRDRRGWLAELSALIPFGRSKPRPVGVGGSRAARWTMSVGLAGAGGVAALWLALSLKGESDATGAAALNSSSVPSEELRVDALRASELPAERDVEVASVLPEEDVAETATSPQERTAEPFVLADRFPALSGVVSSRDGVPIGGAFVSIYYDRIDPVWRDEFVRDRSDESADPGPEAHPIGSTRTDGSGRFSLDVPIPVTRGRVRVRVRAAGFLGAMRRRVVVDLNDQQTLDVTLVPGATLKGRLDFPFLEEGPPDPLYVWAVPEVYGADPISLSTEQNLRAASRVDDPFRHSEEHRVLVDADGRFEISGLGPQRRYWLRSSDPGLRFVLREALAPNEPELLIRVEQRPHVSFSREADDGRPWFVSCRLEVFAGEQELFKLDSSLDPSLASDCLSSAGGPIDYALPIDRVTEHGYHEGQVTQLSGAVRAWYQEGSSRTEIGGTNRRGVRWTLQRSGHTWTLELPQSRFRTGRSLRLSGDTVALRVVDQSGSPLDTLPVLRWRELSGRELDYLPPAELGADQVLVDGPIRPVLLTVQARFGDALGPEQLVAWSPDAAEGLFPPPYVLAPVHGCLQVACEEPERVVALSWMDTGGLAHEVYRGPVSALAEPVALPTGTWQIRADDEEGNGLPVEVCPAENTRVEL